jgi:hypothetical protein
MKTVHATFRELPSLDIVVILCIRVLVYYNGTYYHAGVTSNHLGSTALEDVSCFMQHTLFAKGRSRLKVMIERAGDMESSASADGSHHMTVLHLK